MNSYQKDIEALNERINALKLKLSFLNGRYSNCVVGPWRKQTENDKDGRPLLVQYQEHGELQYQIVRFIESDIEGVGKVWTFNQVFHMINPDYQFIAVADIHDETIAEWPAKAITEARHRLNEAYQRNEVLSFHLEKANARITELEARLSADKQEGELA